MPVSSFPQALKAKEGLNIIKTCKAANMGRTGNWCLICFFKKISGWFCVNIIIKIFTRKAGGFSESHMKQQTCGAGKLRFSLICVDSARHFQMPSEQLLLCWSWTKSPLPINKNKSSAKAGRGLIKMKILLKLLIKLFNVLYLPSP